MGSRKRTENRNSCEEEGGRIGWEVAVVTGRNRQSSHNIPLFDLPFPHRTRTHTLKGNLFAQPSDHVHVQIGADLVLERSRAGCFSVAGTPGDEGLRAKGCPVLRPTRPRKARLAVVSVGPRLLDRPGIARLPAFRRCRRHCRQPRGESDPVHPGGPVNCLPDPFRGDPCERQ